MNLEDHMKILKWPKLSDKLFDHGEPANWMSAQLNFLGKEEKFYVYASGYKVAAEIVFKNLDSKTRVHDILVYPLIFLMRQSIELLLKDIIITCNKIIGNEKKYSQIHSLTDLWGEAIQLLKGINNGNSIEDEKAVTSLISEFGKIDPQSFAFRYPVDKKENASLPGITKIDLQNFMKVSLGLYNYFYGTSCQVSKYWENLKSDI